MIMTKDDESQRPMNTLSCLEKGDLKGAARDLERLITDPDQLERWVRVLEDARRMMEALGPQASAAAKAPTLRVEPELLDRLVEIGAAKAARDGKLGEEDLTALLLDPEALRDLSERVILDDGSFLLREDEDEPAGDEPPATPSLAARGSRDVEAAAGLWPGKRRPRRQATPGPRARERSVVLSKRDPRAVEATGAADAAPATTAAAQTARERKRLRCIVLDAARDFGPLERGYALTYPGKKRGETEALGEFVITGRRFPARASIEVTFLSPEKINLIRATILVPPEWTTEVTLKEAVTRRLVAPAAAAMSDERGSFDLRLLPGAARSEKREDGGRGWRYYLPRGAVILIVVTPTAAMPGGLPPEDRVRSADD